MKRKSPLYKGIAMLAVVVALAAALAAGIVHAAPADYDADGDGFIDRSEVIAAINDYLFSDALSREELIEIINLYLFGDPVAQPEADARLSELNLQNLDLAPAFNPATNTYTATVPDPDASTTIAAVPANPGATVDITVEGAPAASGDTLELDEGTRTVTLQVTSEDGTTTRTYTITITWARPTPTPAPTPTPTPTPAPRPYATSLSQEGFDCFFDRQLALGRNNVAGCSGWDKDTIYKWEQNTISTYISPHGEQRYINITEEVLDYLSPILGLQFVQTAHLDQADFVLFVGVTKLEGDRELYGEACYEAAACAQWYYNTTTSTLTSGTLTVWDDYSGGDITLKALILHEALHVLTGARHSNRLTHVLWPDTTLGLPYMLPYVEDMYRLYAQPFVQPGMLASELKNQIANTPPQRTKTQPEIAVDAYMNIIRHERIDFDVDIQYAVSGCSRFNDAGQVTLSNAGEFPRWDTGALTRGDRSLASWWAGIEGLLLSIAREEKSLADGLTRYVVGVPASTDSYSGYIVDYGVTVDEAGDVQSFDMDWQITTSESSCLNDIRVTGRNFHYSAAALPPPTAEALREADHRRDRDLSDFADLLQRLGAS